jgi:competence protein ComEC
MKALNPYPMARLLFPFMGGILMASILPIPTFYLISIESILVFFLSIWVLGFHKYHSFPRRWFSGFIIVLIFFVFGCMNPSLQSPFQKTQHYSNQESVTAYLFQISQAFTETEKTYKNLGEIKAVYNSQDSCWHASKGFVLLYFQKQDSFPLHYGDKIICNTPLQEIQSPQNPNAFDYKHFMELKGIKHQCFIKEKDWQKVGYDNSFSIQALAIKLRIRLLKVIDKLGYSENNKALAAALLVGYDEYLSDDLRSHFSASGAMHILCVSGLHVGIIYMICNVLFGFLSKIKYGVQLKTMLILAILWFYALMTGFSPSVIRASILFSFIMLGRVFHRRGNPYNSLAASAFFLLLVNPNLIYNIGFQLSYAAVFSIFYSQNKIFNLVKYRTVLGRKTGALLSVSIAAQLGTFPLAIYYFHQFPNYFLLTNLAVIPLAFAVVSSGILVLIIGLTGFSTSILGLGLAAFLKLGLSSLDKGVELIDKLPYAISPNLDLSKMEVFLLYLSIFSLLSFLFYARRKWIYPLLISLILFEFSLCDKNIRQARQQTWTVYKTNGFSAMDFIWKRKSLVYGDSAFIHSPSLEKYILKENHIKRRILEEEQYPTGTNVNADWVKILNHRIILFNALRVVYLDKAQYECKFEKPLVIHYLVIAKDAKIDFARLKQEYDFKYLIFDSSNSLWYRKKMEQRAAELKIPFWDVNQQGAFVLHKKTSENSEVLKQSFFHKLIAISS